MLGKIRKTLIIAEAGVNHNGSLELAFKLCEEAKRAGADVVKFQTWITEKIMTKEAKQATYQLENSGKSESQFDMVKRLELSFADFVKLKEFCEGIDIEFMSTPDEEDSLDFLMKIGMKRIKIGSGEVNNLPFLKRVAQFGKETILSTGMSSMEEVRIALNCLVSNGLSLNQITILHCNTQYPTPPEDVNLRAMLTIKEELAVRVGFSDHTLGIEMPIAATALGAEIIEKHFTLDKNMQGPDHKASLSPEELTHMVKAIRNIELALGDGAKKVTTSEVENKAVVRKSVHIKNPIKSGHSLALEDLIMKRPGDGISSYEIPQLVGKKTMLDLEEDHKLLWSDLDSESN
jgi:N-acetylneuraminate synthase